MKWKSARKLIGMCFTALLVLLLFNTAVYAVPSESKNVITPDALKEWDNGARVEKTSSGSGSNYQINVTADTTGLKKGYYSIYLYDNTARYIESYDGISFSLKNENNTELKINLTLTVNLSTSVAMTDSSYAILESSDQSIKEAIEPTYGTISIPANFDGTVYIPFSKLYTSGGKSVSLNHIQSWGITAVTSENKQIKYQIGDIEFLSGSLAAMKGSYYLIYMSGSSKINVPNTGSVIEFYKAEIKDLDGNPINQSAIFYLKNNVAGASLSKDGKLEIDSNCNASDIKVYAKSENSVNSGEITISMQHIKSAVSFVGIPKASAVTRLTTTTDSVLHKYVNIIRFVSVLIALFFGIIFYRWFSEAKTNYSMIRNKLHHISDYHEGEEKL